MVNEMSHDPKRMTLVSLIWSNEEVWLSVSRV